MPAKPVRIDSLDEHQRRVIADMPANCDMSRTLKDFDPWLVDSLLRADLIQWCDLTKGWTLTAAGLRARNNLLRRRAKRGWK